MIREWSKDDRWEYEDVFERQKVEKEGQEGGNGDDREKLGGKALKLS